MTKLTLTRLEDRIVYDAAPLPAAEPAEPAEPTPSTETADVDGGDADANSNPEESGAHPAESPGDNDIADPSAPVDHFARDASDFSDPGYLPYQPAFEANDAGMELAQPTDSAQLAAFLGRVTDAPGEADDADADAVETREKKEEEVAGANPSATKTGDTVNPWEGLPIFDQYQVHGDADFNRFMLMWIDFVKGHFDGDDFIGHNTLFHEYLIGGRLGVEAGFGGQELNLYWLLDNGEKAYLTDCKFVQNGERLQLIAYRNGEGAFFKAATAGAGAGFYIPYMDVLDQFRFYSVPDDMGDDVRYFLNVNTSIDGKPVGNEGKYLQSQPPEQPPILFPPEEVPPDGPIIDNDDDGQPRPGDQDQPDAPRPDDGLEPSDFDYGLGRNAGIADLVRQGDLPGTLRAEIEELSELVGEVDESEIPAARDIAASIVEMSRTHAQFTRGVSRLVGMLAGLDGLDKTPAVAEWVADMAKRGETLFADNSRHVSQLLRAVKEFRATEAGLRDSMAHAQIAGIGAAMDGINQEMRVIAAGLDRLSDSILSMRGSGDAAGVLALLPAMEEHMAAVAKEMERLDAKRDTMFYVLQSAKAVDKGLAGTDAGMEIARAER